MQRFAEQVTAIGGKATLLPRDLSHAQINAELGAPGDYTTAVDTFMRSLGAGLD